jgi:hypothetical protein
MRIGKILGLKEFIVFSIEFPDGKIQNRSISNPEYIRDKKIS